MEKRLATLAFMSWYDGERDRGRLDLRTSWPTVTLRVQEIGGKDLVFLDRDESKDSAMAVGLESVATLSRFARCSSSGNVMRMEVGPSTGVLSNTSHKGPTQERTESGTLGVSGPSKPIATAGSGSRVRTASRKAWTSLAR